MDITPWCHQLACEASGWVFSPLSFWGFETGGGTQKCRDSLLNNLEWSAKNQWALLVYFQALKGAGMFSGKLYQGAKRDKKFVIIIKRDGRAAITTKNKHEKKRCCIYFCSVKIIYWYIWVVVEYGGCKQDGLSAVWQSFILYISKPYATYYSDQHENTARRWE